MWYVYVLECEGGVLYVGQTESLPNRLMSHIAGAGAVVTKQHRPISLRQIETFEARDKAVARESSLTRRIKAGYADFSLDTKFHGLFEALSSFIDLYGESYWKALKVGEASIDLSMYDLEYVYRIGTPTTQSERSPSSPAETLPATL